MNTTLENYWDAVDALNELQVKLESAKKKCKKEIRDETKTGLIQMQNLFKIKRSELKGVNRRK